MNDFQTLTDAFGELERRADAAMSLHPDPALPVAREHRSRLPLVAASAVGVLAVSVGVAVFASGGGHSGRQAGGSEPLTSTALTSAALSSTAPATFQIPQTASDLARRFRVVLGDTATFTVTDTSHAMILTAPPAPTKSAAGGNQGPARPSAASVGTAKPNGAAIVGELTASGVTGGYDLQIFRVGAGERAWCDDPDRSRCTVRRLADGSSLAIGREPLPGSADGVTYLANLIRPDGVEFLMHVSNEASAKGGSSALAAQPPLTTGQMTAIVTSDRW